MRTSTPSLLLTLLWLLAHPWRSCRPRRAHAVSSFDAASVAGLAETPAAPRFPSFEELHVQLFDVRPVEDDNRTHVVLGFRNPYRLRPNFDDFPFSNLRPAFVSNLLDFMGTGGAKFVVEVGSLHGHSALAIAQAIHWGGLAGTPVLCIDPFSGDTNMWARYRKDRYVRRWVRIQDGRMLTYDQFMVNVRHAIRQGAIPSHHILPFQATSTVGARWLLRNGFTPDLIYIDSAHEEHETLLEISLFYRVLVPGGVIFGDDLGWPAVKADVYRFVSATKAKGPEYACEFNIVQSEPGSDAWHFWVIRKPKLG